MSEGLEHMWNSIRILAGRNATLNQRLYEAAKELAGALDQPEQWPSEELLDQARTVETTLTVDGSLDRTLAGMDMCEASELARQLVDLVADMQVADTRRQAGLTIPLPSATAGQRRRLDLPRANP